MEHDTNDANSSTLTTPMITAALSQQATFQKHQLMARQLVKIQEQHRKQKLQQITQHAQQMYLQINTNLENHNNHQNRGQQPSQQQQQQWWQRGAPSYGMTHYPPMPQSPQSSGDQAGGKSKKKRRRKKKKTVASALDPSAASVVPPQPQAAMEGGALGNLPPFLNSTLFNNGLGPHGLNAPLYLNNAHLQAPAPQFAQNGATPNLSVLIDANAVNYNSANSI